MKLEQHSKPQLLETSLLSHQKLRAKFGKCGNLTIRSTTLFNFSVLPNSMGIQGGWSEDGWQNFCSRVTEGKHEEDHHWKQGSKLGFEDQGKSGVIDCKWSCQIPQKLDTWWTCAWKDGLIMADLSQTAVSRKVREGRKMRNDELKAGTIRPVIQFCDIHRWRHGRTSYPGNIQATWHSSSENLAALPSYKYGIKSVKRSCKAQLINFKLYILLYSFTTLGYPFETIGSTIQQIHSSCQGGVLLGLEGTTSL